MPGSRPFTRRQALQNAAFLEALARTGNARLAARSLGVHRSTFTKRRAGDAARYEQSGDWRFEDEPAPPELPPLHLVTGWSKAAPVKMRYNPELALFGGWRIREMRAKMSKK